MTPTTKSTTPRGREAWDYSRWDGCPRGGLPPFEEGLGGVRIRGVHNLLHAGPFEPQPKVKLSTCGKKRPQNGSKNEKMAPRTSTG